MHTAILYSKPGCHLCEPVREVILAVQRERGFQFVVRNIEDDAADFEKYEHAIPVVVVDGKEIARYKLSRRQLEEALGTE
jgi:glutaredoxin